MIKLLNSEVFALVNTKKNVGLDKLMNHGNLDGDKAYELSLMIPELEKQAKVIEENRKRISNKIFPLDEKTGKQIGLDNQEKVIEFNAEFNKILEKEVELEGEKITLSRKKDEAGKSELNKLNLTVVDLLALKSIIDVK